MRKRLIGSIVACAAVGLAFLGLTACDKSPTDTDGPVGDGGQLAQVDVDSITVREQVFVVGTLGTTFSWDPVENATDYTFVCNGDEVKLTYPSVTIQNFDELTLPADGVFNISISASAFGYTSSEPVSYTYTVRGCELKGISVTALENGVLKWKADPLAQGYLVSVNGAAGVVVNKNELNLSEYSGAVTLDIRAVGDGLYTKNGTPFIVKVNAEHTRMQLLAVENYTVKNGVVSWEPMVGVSKYRIVDIERNTQVITDTSYDYSEKLPLYGVYPISDSDTIDDAEITSVSIPYLDGQGTSAAPYKIKSPIDFRAIDYYEAVYAEKLKANGSAVKTYYSVTKDIDFNSVDVLEEDSNFYALTQPFYGVLDGGGKELSNIRIRHRSGYWAMFDYIAGGGIVRNMKFSSPDIKNEMIQATLPINASIATIAYKNYGVIADVIVKDANYKTAGGEIAGICWDNHGTVQRCEMSGVLVQNATGQPNQACYEMAGIVAENNGTVSDNMVKNLEIRGTAIPDNGSSYNNVRCAAGIVAVNRRGATVSNNSFESVTMSNVLTAIQEHEFGGVVAYNAGSVVKGTGSLGTFIHNGTPVNSEVGGGTSLLGKLIGKNEGSRS